MSRDVAKTCLQVTLSASLRFPTYDNSVSVHEDVAFKSDAACMNSTVEISTVKRDHLMTAPMDAETRRNEDECII